MRGAQGGIPFQQRGRFHDQPVEIELAAPGQGQGIFGVQPAGQRGDHAVAVAPCPPGASLPELVPPDGLIAKLVHDAQGVLKGAALVPVVVIHREGIEIAICGAEALCQKRFLRGFEQFGCLRLGEQGQGRVHPGAQAVVGQQAGAEAVKGADRSGGEVEAFQGWAGGGAGGDRAQDAGPHLGGRFLAKGEDQDFVGAQSLAEQMQVSPGNDFGLAGASASHYPHRQIGRRGDGLRLTRIRDEWLLAGHAASASCPRSQAARKEQFSQWRPG